MSTSTAVTMMVVEPELLRRGKEFHRLVQANWAGEIEKATVRPEHSILFHTPSSPIKRNRRGRLDIFVDRIDDFVTVVEIKSTDWDRIPTANRRRLLAAHRRQVLRYVDEFLDEQHVSVCAGIIYPQAPVDHDLLAQVEQYLNDHALQVVWFAERSPNV